MGKTVAAIIIVVIIYIFVFAIFSINNDDD